MHKVLAINGIFNTFSPSTCFAVAVLVALAQQVEQGLQATRG